MKVTRRKLFLVVVPSLIVIALGVSRLCKELTLPTLAADHRVTRPISDKTPADVRFIYAGDVRRQTGAYEAVLTLARELQVDFVLFLGDVVEEADDDYYRLFVEEISEEGPPCPVYVLPGDYDVHADGGSLFGRVFGTTEFSIRERSRS